MLSGGWPALVGIKELAKLAQPTDALLPIAFVLGETTLVIDEVGSLGSAEGAVIDMVVNRGTEGSGVGAIAAGVATGVSDAVPSGVGNAS